MNFGVLPVADLLSYGEEDVNVFEKSQF